MSNPWSSLLSNITFKLSAELIGMLSVGTIPLRFMAWIVGRSLSTANLNLGVISDSSSAKPGKSESFARKSKCPLLTSGINISMAK